MKKKEIEKNVYAELIIIKDGGIVCEEMLFTPRHLLVLPSCRESEFTINTPEEEIESCVRKIAKEIISGKIKTIKKIYEYDNLKYNSLRHYYLCEFDGEWDIKEKCGRLVGLIPLERLSTYPIESEKIRETISEDYANNGSKLRDDIKYIVEEK